MMKYKLTKRSMIIFVGLTLAFFVINSYASTKNGYAIARIEQYSSAINRFHRDVGRYPSSSEGLKILIERPKDVTNWKGPYLPHRVILTDPWNNEYKYIYPAKYGHKEYDLYSFGPNGNDDKGSKDDFSNWKLIK